MKKNIQKILTVAFTAVLATSVLSGCAITKKKTEPTATAEKPITFKVFYATPGKTPPDDNRILKKVAEKTGVTLQIEYLTGEVKQKIGVMVAGGDYPDFIDAGDGSALMIDAQAFYPIENDIDKYPNIKNYLGSDWSKMKDPKDGHIYYVPQFGVIKNKNGATNHSGEAFWIQKAVLKEFGYPEVPKTLDAYFDLIKKYKEKYPTIDGQKTIGFEILTYDWKSFCLTNPPAFLMGQPNNGIGVVDEKNLTVSNFADKDASKQYYKKLNDVYNQGLIDPETFTANYDQYIAKLSSGRVLGMIDQGWDFGDAVASLVKQDKLERTYVPCPVTLGGVPDRYADRPVLNTNAGMAITSKCSDKQRALKFINDLLAEDTQKLLRWGEKDVDYKVNDKGVVYRTEEQRKQQSDNDWRLANTGDPLIWFPHNEGYFDDGNAINLGEQPDEFIATLKPYDKEFLAAYKKKTFSEFVSPAPPNPVYYPMWTTNFPAGAPETVAKAKLEELQKKYNTKLILAASAEYDKVWNEYMDQLKTVDMKAYEGAMTKELQRRVKEWK